MFTAQEGSEREIDITVKIRFPENHILHIYVIAVIMIGNFKYINKWEENLRKSVLPVLKCSKCYANHFDLYLQFRRAKKIRWLWFPHFIGVQEWTTVILVMNKNVPLLNMHQIQMIYHFRKPQDWSKITHGFFTDIWLDIMIHSIAGFTFENEHLNEQSNDTFVSSRME